MALRKEDLLAINQLIDDAIRKAIETLKPHGWRKLLHNLREWGVLAANVSVILALLAIVVTGIYQATARVKDDAKFQQRASDRLDSIEQSIQEIKGALVKQALIAHAALPPADFRKSLAELGSSLSDAKQQKLKIATSVMEGLSRKLASTDTAAPHYWPVAADLISYRSELLQGELINWAAFPPCGGVLDLDHLPDAWVQGVGPDKKPVGDRFRPMRTVQNCYVDIDGKDVSRLTCKHCVVKYSGGPVSLTDVYFEDCLFVFVLPKQRPPSPSGQRLSQILLASNLDSVEIPLL